MHEKPDLNSQKTNATLARFYEWAKQLEKPTASLMIHQTPVAKRDKEKSDVSSAF
jgi:hypothetical protein